MFWSPAFHLIKDEKQQLSFCPKQIIGDQNIWQWTCKIVEIDAMSTHNFFQESMFYWVLIHITFSCIGSMDLFWALSLQKSPRWYYWALSAATHDSQKNIQDPKFPHLPPLLDMGSLKSLTKEEGNHSIHHHEVIVFWSSWHTNINFGKFERKGKKGSKFSISHK